MSLRYLYLMGELSLGQEGGTKLAEGYVELLLLVTEIQIRCLNLQRIWARVSQNTSRNDEKLLIETISGDPSSQIAEKHARLERLQRIHG